MSDQQSALHIEFYKDVERNEGRSRVEGRPMFDEKVFIRIRFPGDKHRELVAPANQPSLRDPNTNTWLTYADRYPKHYEAFMRNEQFIGDGTPIDEAPFLTNAQKAELKAVHIHTIDALANLPETNLSKLGMGGRKWMEQARAYVERAKDSAVETRLAAENADMRSRIESLEALIRSTMAPAPVAAPEETGPFAGWAAEDLKAFLKDKTGSAPRGNPSLETLIRMAEEATAEQAA